MSLLLTAVSVTYLVPTAVAVYRNHHASKAIFFTNLLLGWTVIGWFAAMVWACTGEDGVQPVETSGDLARPGGGLRLQGRDPRFDETPHPRP